MSRICELCNKKPHMGKSIAKRGIAKNAGGIGLKTTGVAVRRFLPNLQMVRAQVNGGTKSLRVCTKCIKAGKVVKAPRRNYQPSTT